MAGSDQRNSVKMTELPAEKQPDVSPLSTACREQPSNVPASMPRRSRTSPALCSVGANARHGRQRSNDDKQRSVLTLLKDEEWGRWSDREIARRCQVGNTMVSNYRKELTVLGGQLESTERLYTTKHGTRKVLLSGRWGRRLEAVGESFRNFGQLSVFPETS